MNLTNDGIVISEKIAKDLDVKVGDKIEINNSNDKKAKVKITGNSRKLYISLCLYFTNNYKKLFNKI